MTVSLLERNINTALVYDLDDDAVTEAEDDRPDYTDEDADAAMEEREAARARRKRLTGNPAPRTEAKRTGAFDMFELSRLLGHASIAITDRVHAHLRNKDWATQRARSSAFLEHAAASTSALDKATDSARVALAMSDSLPTTTTGDFS